MADPIEPTAEGGVTVRYLIDSTISKFTVQAFAGGLLSALGHNPTITIRDFSGDAEVNLDNLEKSSLRFTVRAESLEVEDDISDKDGREIERVMHEQVLESSGYPEIEYDCSRVSASKTGEGQYWVGLSGVLTLHGATRSLTIPARVTIDGNNLKASGNFSLLQSNFGIKPVSVAGGTLKVKDELKCAFEIVAKKQV